MTIVGQNFTEADVLSELYRALLDQAGFTATIKPLGGRDLYLGPLEKGTVQVAGDSLSATTDALNNRAHGDDAVSVSSPDVAVTLDQLAKLGEDVGLTPLRPARAELKSGFAVTRAFATRLGLKTLSDLGRLGKPVTLAASPDCAERADCAEGLENVYGITLAKVEPLGSGTADTKAALMSGQAQLAQVATTDAQIGTDLVLLDDDKHMLNAENLVPLVNTRWLKGHEPRPERPGPPRRRTHHRRPAHDDRPRQHRPRVRPDRRPHLPAGQGAHLNADSPGRIRGPRSALRTTNLTWTIRVAGPPPRGRPGRRRSPRTSPGRR